MASIRKNFAYNAAYQIVKIITPLVTTPYLARVLGADNVGLYSYTYSITNYFVLFAVLGMSTYGVRAVATVGDDRTKRSQIFWSAYVSQLTISAMACLAYIAYSLIICQGGPFLCALWSFWVISCAADISWLMFGVEDFKATTIRSLIVKLGELALIFLLVKTDQDLWLYVAIISGGYLVSQVILWPFVPRHVDFVRPTWSEVRVHYLPNLRLFVPVVAVSLYTTLDKVLLGTLSTMEQTGFYEYSEKVSKIPLALITALGTVMLPHMSTVFACGDEEGGKDLIEESMWLMQAGAFAMAFGIVAIAPELAPVFLGDEFADCAPIMALLAAVIPLISGSNVIGRQYLIPKVRDNQYTLSVLVGSAVDLAVIIPLAPRFGAMGAAVATVCAEGAVLLAQAWMVRHELPLGRYVLNVVPFAACGALMLVVVRFAAAVFNGMWGLSVQGLALEILVGAVVFCIAACCFCVKTKNRHFMRMFGKYVRRLV